MRVFPHLLSTTLILGVAAAAQAPQATPAAPAPKLQTHQPAVPIPTATITTGTQLVVVDVVVQDNAGNPVRGLPRGDFAVSENKKPQAVKTFDEHAAADFSHAKLPPPLHLPPGTFTDYEPVPADSTLNVLLLDALNTPMKDQAYVRYQLQQFVKNEKPGTRVAIFGLTNHLILLQGFSSDPEVLKSAVEHRLIPRASVLLDDAAGSNTDPMSMADAMTEAGASATAVAGVQQFEAQNATFQTQLRIDYTVAAFENIARYLGSFPGRKNLIWFSGSFPLTIFPDPSLDDPFAIQNDAGDQLREASNLLDRARVAVYPIDARGLQTTPMFDASRSGRAYVGNPGRMSRDIAAFNQQNAQEHMAMEQVAEDTGGHAFYNTNGLAAAVTKAIEAGSNYYTLTYTPTNREQRGEYRNIQVQLEGDFAARGLKLSYRRGYYADDPHARHPSTSILAPPVAAPPTGSPAYAFQSMQRGSPTPAEILFKVRVLPDSTATEATVAPKNELNPSANLKGPYRRYDLDFAALASDFSIPLQSDGRRHGAIEFVALVYDADGKLLNIEGDTINLNLTPESYTKALKSAFAYRLQISAPARNESFLRIGVHDVISGRMGVVEIPTTAVDRLPPPPPPPAAPAASTPPPAASSPATSPPAAPK
ncbi:MAG TPA: VWA domain-containing protein [Acidobacteriaceae bacterium]|nr:VWA domain-containing protein [Acidobacteriaceae bacterium]